MTTPFRVGYVPGVTLTKWVRIWNERMPDRPLEIVRITPSTQVAALTGPAGDVTRVDVSFVRLPVDRTGLSVIPLYTEAPVVIAPKDSVLADVESVELSDLAGETLLPVTASHTDREIEDAVELVAAGGGLLQLPQSLARLHSRRDVLHRPVTDADPTEIALAWFADDTTPEIEEFVGIVRGRTARSSRTSPTGDQAQPGAGTGEGGRESSGGKTGARSGPRDGRKAGQSDGGARDRARGDARKRAQAKAGRKGGKGKRR
ncbi:LysR family substrate-binding domain-containing protein [Planctomonas psychrotolerans]|uniref:LysR family substrate-binding domain-containing protein n=1 Tax=Planctomonas psychrotolerans TaxID=2528712 RepID=UPI001D0D3CE4|nr:LysR family substrate-binding domain-containing protein [Planctomonas psychrotolerans]